MATIVHLLRHAEHGLLGRVLAGRMEGVGLSAAGRAQADALAAGLSSRPIAAVWSSPLQRARETAAPLAARLGLAVTVEAGLNEVDFGGWTGLGFDELHGRPEWVAWNCLRSCNQVPGGESMGQAQARALDAVWRLCRAVGDGEAAVVSHSDVLKAVLAHVLGMPVDLMQRMEIDPASRSVVTFHGTDVRVNGVNLPCGGAGA